MNKIKFETNTPEQITLRHASGKIVDGRFGQQVYYSLADGRCMYLDLGVAQKLNVLDVQAGESISICKRGGGIWDVWLSPETERMRSARDVGTVEERLRASVGEACETRYAHLKVPVGSPVQKVPTPITAGASVTAPAPAQATTVSSSHSNTGNVSTGALVDEANILVDAFAEVLERALTTYQGRIKPDDVRSLLLSAYITKSKGAKSYAA